MSTYKISVSIPFKRERLSEQICYAHCRSFLWGFGFQFPSNGKGFPNRRDWINTTKRDLGFNSLQTGKAFRTRLYAALGLALALSFNSLQTGKAFRTGRDRHVSGAYRLFQFPSNGKGFPNRTPSKPSHSAG